MKLEDGSRVGIVGGGPAGSMAGFFLMELASRMGMALHVDLYEARDFSKFGPAGCNMCAGVVSESLVQILAAEGISLPPLVVQHGIDAYVLHTTSSAPLTIHTPLDELRIATVYRGSGPQHPCSDMQWGSFDQYMLSLAQQRGVRVLHGRVVGLEQDGGRPRVLARNHPPVTYDLLIGATGVNSGALQLFEQFGFQFRSPKTGKGFLAEIYLGVEQVQQYLGSSMHIFLLDIPRLRFAALIPKMEYVTVCLLGDNIDRELVDRFMDTPEVRRCFPAEFVWHADAPCSHGECAVGTVCRCGPKLTLGLSSLPYTDRVVMIGDSAISRLYKDGIGAAYVTAKSCAVTAIFLGVSGQVFADHYGPVCQRIDQDNRIGRLIFAITMLYQKVRLLRDGMIRLVRQEQRMDASGRFMSRILWDTFTGSATYLDILLRALRPMFLLRLAVSTLLAALTRGGMR
jgi:flavin-dependent dehydrogenase